MALAPGASSTTSDAQSGASAARRSERRRISGTVPGIIRDYSGSPPDHEVSAVSGVGESASRVTRSQHPGSAQDADGRRAARLSRARALRSALPGAVRDEMKWLATPGTWWLHLPHM